MFPGGFHYVRSRVDYFRFDSYGDSLYVPPGVWDPALDEVSLEETEPSGGLSVLYRASQELRPTAGWFRGYRYWAPRFGATQLAIGIEVPSGSLPPVTADTFELGTKVRVAALIEGACFVYYTWFDHNQVLVRGTFNGEDWYDYDPNENVYVRRGTRTAWLYGVKLGARLMLNAVWQSIPSWSLRCGFDWKRGRDRETGQPLRFTVPPPG